MAALMIHVPEPGSAHAYTISPGGLVRSPLTSGEEPGSDEWKQISTNDNQVFEFRVR